MTILEHQTSNDCELVDIVIAGAGLVGAPLAAVLNDAGWSVTLLDAGAAVNQVDNQIDNQAVSSFDALQQRCTALSLGTKHWFADQGLWHLIADDACAIEQVCVSHKGYFGATRLHAHEVYAEAVGYVVNNTFLCKSVLNSLLESSVNHVTNARVTSVTHHDNHVQVQYGIHSAINARLLIAADGVSSRVRESAGIQTRHVDYEQAAVLGTVQLEGSHDNVAYERFTSSGPLALLPRTGPYMSFVDCINPCEQSQVEQLDDVAYLARLQSRFGYRLGRFAAVGQRLVTPLVRIEATEQIAHRTVLLGNAMRLLHPVGGQGYNLAMRDVAELVSLLVESGLAADPGSSQMLTRFVERRAKDQKRVVQFSDALARGFRGKATLPAHIRSLGLLGLDTVSPLRREFAQRTMGLRG